MKEFKVVKTMLTFVEATQFIEDVCSYYFYEDENGKKTYNPFLGEIGYKNAFLKYYTDFEFTGDVETDYAEIANFSVYDNISSICLEQFSNIERAIHGQVEFGKQQILNNKTDTLSELLRTITKKIESFDMNSVTEFMNRFNESGLNADGIVKAYLDTDIHKEKEKDIIDTQAAQLKMLKEQVTNEVMRKLVESRNVVTDEPKKKPTTRKTTAKKKVVEFPKKE